MCHNYWEQTNETSIDDTKYEETLYFRLVRLLLSVLQTFGVDLVHGWGYF